MRNFSKDTKQLSGFFDSINKQSRFIRGQVNQLNRSVDVFKDLQKQVNQVPRVNQLPRSANIFKPLQTQVNEINQVPRLADMLKPLQTQVNEINQVSRSADLFKDLQKQVNQVSRSADLLKRLQTEVDELNQVSRSADLLKRLQTQARQVYQDVGLIESVREQSGLVNESLLPVPEQIPVPDEEPEIEIIWYSKIRITKREAILMAVPEIWELLKPHLIEGIKSGNKHLTELLEQINDLPIEEVLRLFICMN